VVSFTSGALAGAAATVASYPFDLLRTTLAAQGEPKVCDMFYYIYKYIKSFSNIQKRVPLGLASCMFDLLRTTLAAQRALGGCAGCFLAS
jgi:hypothetical protein